MVTLQFNEVVKDLAKCCSEQLKFLIFCFLASAFSVGCNFKIRFKLQQITFILKITKKRTQITTRNYFPSPPEREPVIRGNR